MELVNGHSDLKNEMNKSHDSISDEINKNRSSVSCKTSFHLNLLYNTSYLRCNFHFFSVTFKSQKKTQKLHTKKQ